MDRHNMDDWTRSADYDRWKTTDDLSEAAERRARDRAAARAPRCPWCGTFVDAPGDLCPMCRDMEELATAAEAGMSPDGDDDGPA